MPCYSYTSNEPIYYSPNNGDWSVERVYTASGPTYSYAAIARICEVPAADQLCVYTRPNSTGTETKLTLGLDYTVNTTTENIVLTGSATGQVVIRRCTPNNKMLFKFVNGAKITAEQLNASLYQLLFISQEKEFVGTTVNEYYPIAIGASNWSSATNYVPNNYVLYNGNIYKALASNTNSAPPNSNWALVNPASNGFVIQGGETIAGPIKFNLANVTTGSSLVWTGSEFSAGTITGLIDNLADVEITTPTVNKSILVYNDVVSKWQNKLPTVDITQSNLILKDFAFYSRDTANTGVSYSRDDAPISAPTLLDTFKDSSNQYVLTHAPTVYHIVKKLIPTSDAPETFFANVYNILNQVAVNVSNPVKVQLYWNLNRGVPATDTLQDISTSEKLVSYKLSFWDDPKEFYDSGMFLNPQLLARHGINITGGVVYQDNPFFFRTIGATPAEFYSKLTGKGVKAFYLNVPECYNTALCNIPITITASGNTTFFQRSNLQLAALRDPNSASYRDEYLTALRDYAFAGVRSPLSTATTVKDYDSQSRYAKGWLLSVDYNGWEDVSYKRLELQSESTQPCLFKMPKQIIYYNKQAMVFDANATAATTGSGWPNTAVDSSVSSGDEYSKSVRFTGTGVLTENSTNASTTSYSSMGSLFKADGFWGNWCSKWEADPSVFHFNEADIDWAVGNVTNDSSLTLNLWDLTTTTSDLPGPTGDNTALARFYNRTNSYPWIYRPNYYEKTVGGAGGSTAYDGLIGTHFFNIDSNTLFSTASNFVPDPRDEYVFRLIVKDTLFSVFNKPSSHNIASAIILEHGFDEHPENAERSKIQDGIVNIYRKNQTPRQIQRTKTRLSKNDVKVFIQSEHFEKLDNTTNQYVINLCISVPRLKAIGYARVFRKVLPSDNTYVVSVTSATAPTESELDADLGPWTFYIKNDVLDNTGTEIGLLDDGFGFEPYYNQPTGTLAGYRAKRIAAAGRNECAVKFTRLGIPNNLWIRMSVLNTDGTTEFVQSTGFVFS